MNQFQLPVNHSSNEAGRMSAFEAGKVQDGPDFICVGAQKAGTGWLYEQLRNHPDFWMPPMKELHYFDRREPKNHAVRQRSLPLARKESDRIAIARERARDDRDHEFLRRFQQLTEQPSLDLQAYADLFAPKGNSLSGDITPGYSLLNEPLIEQITGRFSTTKVLFIARDPVERVWSQLSMYVRRGLIERFDPNDPDQINQHLGRPEIRARSYPSEIVRRWRRYVSAELFQVYFFDDLKTDPFQLRASIITFLNADPNKSSGALSADYNAKAEKQKLPLTEAARGELARFFQNELRACAAELGGPAADWPKRYGF